MNVWRLAVVHWPVLAVCALFLLVATIVFDDYGVSLDVWYQHHVGAATLDYLAGGGERALNQVDHPHDRYYGAVFEAPLVLLGRVLGLEDTRDILLSRHFLTHCFFLISGIFCYSLVYGIFKSRYLALIAMALFLLHPRLYAHSFFNSKDIPFLSMFMISLWLVHRAFRRDSLSAFLICGAGVALLVNLRIMGLILFAAVLGLRALDVILAGSMEKRNRKLLTMGAFFLSAILTYYAVSAWLWVEPFGEFIEAFRTLSNHPYEATNLFRGEILDARNGISLEYIPVWIGITTPPVVMLLAVIGLLWILWQAVLHPNGVIHATSLRFQLLIIFLAIAPILFIALSKATVYDHWRQVYFLYAPVSLLSVYGAWWLISRIKYEYFWGRALIHAVPVLLIAITVLSMMRIHPLQDNYFNTMVDRNAPGYLVSQYQMGNPQYGWGVLEKIVHDHPDSNIFLPMTPFYRQDFLLPAENQIQTVVSPRLLTKRFYSDRPVIGRDYVTKLYNSTLSAISGQYLENVYSQEAIIRTALSSDPVVRTRLHDIHLHDLLMVIVKRECYSENLVSFIYVHVYPKDPELLHVTRRGYGFDSYDFGIFFSSIDYDFQIVNSRLIRTDRCIFPVLLPDYPVVGIRVGGYDGSWDVWIDVEPFDADQLEVAGKLISSATFDIHWDGDALTYVKDGCTDNEAETQFFLHVFPNDPDALQFYRRQYGFDNLDFRLRQRGGRAGDRCIARVPLPAYPIASVRTGQYDATGELWSVEFALPDRE